MEIPNYLDFYFRFKLKVQRIHRFLFLYECICVDLIHTSGSNRMASFSDIQSDAEDINKLLYAAKTGKWDVVWQILGRPTRPRKHFLINCIPENRRWGVLHQAIWLNNMIIVKQLLECAACDVNLRAKEGISEIGQTGGKTAEEIAVGFKRTEIAELLKQKASCFTPQDTQTFFLLSSECEDCILSLLKITLSAYKNTFLPQGINNQSFEKLLRNVWRRIDTVQGHWELVRDKVAEASFVVCQRTSDKIKECKSKEAFLDLMIKIYTEEDNRLYDHLNTALRRQREDDYMPTGTDLALGPFVIMFQLLLLYWGKLSRENRTTYRKMLVTDEELEKYEIGTKFAWMSFVSSSVELAKAKRFPT